MNAQLMLVEVYMAVLAQSEEICDIVYGVEFQLIEEFFFLLCITSFSCLKLIKMLYLKDMTSL